MNRCIHILGAPGSGTTTLGQALAARLSIAFFDTDQFYWENWPVDFLKKREPEARERLLESTLSAERDWVLAGSIDGWNNNFEQNFGHVIFLYLEPAKRMNRLRQREIDRFGEAAIAPGGSQHEHATYFLDWAAHYDDGTREGRSLPRHETWMKNLTCPVLRLNTEASVPDLVQTALKFLEA